MPVPTVEEDRPTRIRNRDTQLKSVYTFIGMDQFIVLPIVVFSKVSRVSSSPFAILPLFFFITDSELSALLGRCWNTLAHVLRVGQINKSDLLCWLRYIRIMRKFFVVMPRRRFSAALGLDVDDGLRKKAEICRRLQKNLSVCKPIKSGTRRHELYGEMGRSIVLVESVLTSIPAFLVNFSMRM